MCSDYHASDKDDGPAHHTQGPALTLQHTGHTPQRDSIGDTLPHTGNTLQKDNIGDTLQHTEYTPQQDSLGDMPGQAGTGPLHATLHTTTRSSVEDHRNETEPHPVSSPARTPTEPQEGRPGCDDATQRSAVGRGRPGPSSMDSAIATTTASPVGGTCARAAESVVGVTSASRAYVNGSRAESVAEVRAKGSNLYGSAVARRASVGLTSRQQAEKNRAGAEKMSEWELLFQPLLAFVDNVVF